MKRLLLFCAFMSAPVVVMGHVGSPNVFFEGQAGPYPLRVIIRPPATLPGIAQVDVRVNDSSARSVALKAAPWESSIYTAPTAVRATAVAGESNLFNAALWLLQNGSYKVHVTVEGGSGEGTALVPLNSAAFAAPTMSGVMLGTLLALGALLFVAASWFAGAAARDGTLEPGLTPTRRDRHRGRVVAFSTAGLLAGAIYAGAMRWQKMDRDFRSNALSKPLPVSASIRTNGTLRLLHLGVADENIAANGWDTLVADHGKLMHLFLLREPDFDAFAHLHPVRRDARNFEGVLPSLPAGLYRLYAEITHENGLSQTLVANLTLPAPAGRAPQLPGASSMLKEVLCLSVAPSITNAAQPFALDADDSWHIGVGSGRPDTQSPVSQLMGGSTMHFENAGRLIANRESSLRFRVFTSDGEPATLQSYMGMLGHAVVRRSDGAVFTHLHPVGTISMAAQELLVQRELSASGQTNANLPMASVASGSASAGNEVIFPYAFPRPGDYRLWVQVRTGGRVVTGVFDAAVSNLRAPSLKR